MKILTEQVGEVELYHPGDEQSRAICSSLKQHTIGLGNLRILADAGFHFDYEPLPKGRPINRTE